MVVAIGETWERPLAVGLGSRHQAKCGDIGCSWAMKSEALLRTMTQTPPVPASDAVSGDSR
jgi:hypothetical protein